jgi:SAM-dependent methyltransferase
MPTTERPHRRARRQLTARNADRYVLYQRAVQRADKEARFLARIFKRITCRPALRLREDFCGTALLCAEWVKKRGRSAVGIDIDPEPLAWGAERNLAPLGEKAERVRLLRQDVRARCPGRFDLTVALNFSYCVFRTREDLRDYFAGVRRSLAPDGLFVFDALGGHQSWRVCREPRRLSDFTYIWDQSSIDPIANTVVSHIHFHFPDGSGIKNAFTYEWRLWTLPELRELLAEAGFSRSTVYWEDGGDVRYGTGTYRPRARVEQEAAWVAYVAAER